MLTLLIPIVKELGRLSDLQNLGYIFAGRLLLPSACTLIIFSDTPFYFVYSSAPQLFNFLPPLDNQQTGGIIMKIVQELV